MNHSPFLVVQVTISEAGRIEETGVIHSTCIVISPNFIARVNFEGLGSNLKVKNFTTVLIVQYFKINDILCNSYTEGETQIYMYSCTCK